MTQEKEHESNRYPEKLSEQPIYVVGGFTINPAPAQDARTMHHRLDPSALEPSIRPCPRKNPCAVYRSARSLVNENILSNPTGKRLPQFLGLSFDMIRPRAAGSSNRGDPRCPPLVTRPRMHTFLTHTRKPFPVRIPRRHAQPKTCDHRAGPLPACAWAR